MAIAVAADLDQLKLLTKREDRREAAQKLLNVIDFDGSTLFKYHMVPHILATEPWTVHADIAAGVRWWTISGDEEKQAYWIHGTTELIKGSILPLQRETLEDFLAGRLYSQSTDPDEEDPRADLGQNGDTVAGSPSGWPSMTALESALPAEPSFEPVQQRETSGTTTENISQLAAKLTSMAHGDERYAYFKLICQTTSEDGRSLFEYHATACVNGPQSPHVKSAMDEINVSQMWNSLPNNEKRYWQHNTTMMRSGLSRNLLNGLDHLKTDRSTKRSAEYVTHIKDSINRLAPDAFPIGFMPDTDAVTDAQSIIVNVAAEQQSGQRTSTPILDFLYGGSTIGMDSTPVILKVLQSIGTLKRNHNDMKLRVRHTGMRVNYDPAATGVTSIAVRLHTAVHRSLTVKRATEATINMQSHFDWLLRPLFIFNEHSAAFAGLGGVSVPSNERWKYTLHYRSCLQWMKKHFDVIRPLNNDTEMVKAIIMRAVRERVAKLHPGHYLLSTISELLPRSNTTGPSDIVLIKKLRNWGLANDHQGFGLHIKSCFDPEGLISEEYEDLVEQKMYALHRAEHNILFTPAS